MDLRFERGNRSEPRGHALIYFRPLDDPSRTLATYVVVAPIALDLAKYVPPLFAGRLPMGGTESVSAFPIPPFPEPVESEAWLQALAEARQDDLIFAGSIDDQPERLLMATAEAARLYADLYQSFAATIAARPPAEETYDVQDLFYQLMSEQELVSEVAKLTGKLRYAVEGHDRRLTTETVQEMERVAARLPAKYRLAELIEAAAMPGERGRKLSELLIERGYRILREEYAGLDELEQRIRVLGQGGEGLGSQPN